jgi:hypothetical protein
VSFLHFFNRLTFGEEMPSRQKLRRLRRKLSTTTLGLVFVSVWLVVTAGMLSAALVLTHTGRASEAGGSHPCAASEVLLAGCGR